MRSAAASLPILLAALAAASPAAALTGVCPDGSFFIVQSASAIPCPEAKRVDPNDLPPIQPGNLPRPYGWERFNRRADPNNPYNLVDVAPAGESIAAPVAAAPPELGPPVAQPTALAVATPPAVAPSALDLAFATGELADLDELVGLMQQVAPATLVEIGPDGAPRALLALARSGAFEQRVHAALARQGGGGRGPVVLFRAEAHAPQGFHGHLTFVQGHIAFHPDPANPDQFGVIDGRLGELAPGDRVLGYAVLPAHLDPAQPLDIYWDDRRITATLR